ncbi:MAG: putative toxin-antitoxin system toxin component, PIN family [Candidatus Rokubacteria bacterium]|nr:putative toxin-antitoxin system toxin component, PIN family [Candidatus Rokubacteria bacterium]MBI3105346.1 putative toxin-antitoxin system toxin component, PIN family [Candidatus Rokubacteria bacterium]
MRVVFDTNVFVSALVVPGSLSEEACRRALAREFRLVTSVAILTELAGRLRSKFGWDNAPTARAVKAIARVAEVVKTTPHLEIARDPPDNRILECAGEGAADLIVTGDRHLLKLRRFGRTGIVRVSTFLHTLG